MQNILVLIVALVSLFQISFGSRISEIHTKTSSDILSGMDSAGSVSVEICTIVDIPFGGQDIKCCQAHNLRNSNKNDFQLGSTDVFGPDEIENCYNFELLSNYIIRLSLWHCGTDAWKPDWIRMMLSDGSFLQCDNVENVFLDNQNSLSLKCHKG